MEALFGIICIGLAVWQLIYAQKLKSKADQSLTWPIVKGEITHSSVISLVQSGGMYSVAHKYQKPRSVTATKSAHVITATIKLL